MQKNILVLHTQNNVKPLLDLFEELKSKGYNISFLTTDNKLLNFCKEKKIRANKLKFWPPIDNSPKLKINLFLGKYYFSALLILLIQKFNKKINYIICVNWIEKLLFTPIAKMLGIKIIWLETRLDIYPNLKINQKILLKRLSRSVKLVSFTNFSQKTLINFGMKKDSVILLSPGIKLSHQKHQENLFSRLAQGDQFRKRKKFFTIGTIVNLNQVGIEQKMETLLRAIQECLRMIPDLQLIIIGEGKERKSLMWLAKKMEIDNYIWFIGEQPVLKKWLDSFDIYITNCAFLNLVDINNVLMAQAARLPIIGPNNIGLDFFIQTEKSGLLLEKDGSDALTQAILRLYKDKHLRKRLGTQAKEYNKNNFSIEKQVQAFQEILN